MIIFFFFGYNSKTFLTDTVSSNLTISKRLLLEICSPTFSLTVESPQALVEIECSFELLFLFSLSSLFLLSENENENLDRHCTPPILITVSNNKMYILSRKNARFEDAKIFIVFKIRFGYKNRARALVPFFFATLTFLLFWLLFDFFFD